MERRQPRRSGRRPPPDRTRRRPTDSKRAIVGAYPNQTPDPARAAERLAIRRPARARGVDTSLRDARPAVCGRPARPGRGPEIPGQPPSDRVRGPLMSANGRLTYEVLVMDGEPIPGRPAPDGSPSMWSPTSATLICGEKHA